MFDVESKQKTSNFKKTLFLTVVEKQNAIVRLLSPDDHVKQYVHYVNKTSVACLGDTCPLCMNNRRLMMENPENYKNMSGWYPNTKRYYLNVLDRTVVKVCPKCQAENKKIDGRFAPTCFACNTFIVNEPEEASNKVKVFNFGVRVAEKLNAMMVHPVDGSAVDISKFDIGLIATGTGTGKEINLVPIKERADEIEISPDDLYDLESVVIRLEPGEMLKLTQGISLKDIFAARRKDDDVPEGSDDLLSKLAAETKEELSAKIAKMF